METDARQTLFNIIGPEMEKMKNILLLVLMCSGFVSCEKEPVEVIFADLSDRKGVFIASEGNFMYGNASLCFYDKEATVVFNNLFFARNRAPLGDVAQSITSDGRNLYIVVNNSGKIVVVDQKTLEFRHAITGLVSPRYIHFINRTKAYVSDLYSGKITIFNPEKAGITGTITISGNNHLSGKRTTEFFTQVGNRVFVSCWANDNQILVIDPAADTITGSITVPAQPRKMVADKNSKLWVLTDGNYAGSTTGYEPPSLVRIDPETLTVEQIFRWNPGREYSGDLQLNPLKDTLYIISGDLFKMAVSAGRFPEEPFVTASGRKYYSLGVDPRSGEIYLADAIDYMQKAMVYRFSAGGSLRDTFRVGINPGSFWFN
jgi:hypothetical protein